MKSLKMLLMLAVLGLAVSSGARAQSTDFTYPTNPDDCIDRILTFDWEYTGGSTVAENGYTLQVSTDLDFSSFVINESGINSSSFTISTELEYETTYFWRTITEFTPSGQEVSASATFTTREAPPALSSPNDNVYCVDLNDIEFTWSDISADYYELEIATTDAFGGSIVHSSSTITPGNTYTYSAGPLTKNTSYFWRVRGGFNSSCGETEWSPIWQFRTFADPPALVGPVDGAKCVYNNAAFDWDIVPGASSYDVEFASDPGFAEEDQLYLRENHTSNTFTMVPGNLEYYADFWWRVRANFGTDCHTDWQTAFTAKTSQPSPTPTAPTQNSLGAPLTPDLEWEADDTYPIPEFDLQVATDANFMNILYNEAGLTSTAHSSSFTLDSPELEFNTSYYWRVKAHYGGSDNCVTDWSPTQTFKTQYVQAVPKYPEDKSECISLTYEFSWNNVQDADKYHLQVSQNQDMSEPEIDITNITTFEKEVTLENGMTDYYWRVRGEDSQNFGPWSSIWEFSAAHNAPVIVQPVDDSTALPLVVTFVWEEIHPDAKYTFLLNTTPEFEDPLIILNDLESATLTQTMPEYFETYYWTVMGEANDCSSGWSDTVQFTTAISAPDLITPANNALKESLIPYFTWTKTEGENVEYEFALSKLIDFSELEDSQLQLEVNATTADIELDELTTYFWRVRASNTNGSSSWSEIFSFTTGEKSPGIPVLISPESGTEKLPSTVTLKWHAAERAEYYELRVATNLFFINPVFEITEADNHTDTIREVTNLENNRAFFWQVRAGSEYGKSDWSDPWSFGTTGIPPETSPNLLTPEDEEEDVSIPVKFSWDGTVNTTKYQLQVTTNSTTFTENDIVADLYVVAPNTERWVSELQTETFYYWRVRSHNSSGAGPWSETRKFKSGMTSVEDLMRELLDVTVAPNPFTTSVDIQFNLPNPEMVVLKIYNSIGQEMATLNSNTLGAGMHSFKWSPGNIESGAYFYSIQIGSYLEMNQMILIR